MLSSRSAPAWIDEDQGDFVTAEFSRICQDPVDGIYVVPLYMDNLLWKGFIMVRAGVYSGGTFRFTLQLPAEFPNSPEIPKVTFEVDIYHPYIAASTHQLCLQSCFPLGRWHRETNRIIDILQYLQEAFAVLTDKFPLDPLSIVNLNAASLFENDFDNFQLRAEEIVAISRHTVYDSPTDCLDPYLIVFTPWEEAKMDPIRRKLLGLPPKTPESSSTTTSRTISDFSSRGSRGTAGDADDERPGSTGSGLDDVSLRNLTALNFDDELEASSKPTPTHELSDLSSVDLESAPPSARNSLIVPLEGTGMPPEAESKDDVRGDFEEESNVTTDLPDVPSKQTVVDVDEKGYGRHEDDEDVDSEDVDREPNKPVAFRIGGDDSSAAELTDDPEDSGPSNYQSNSNFNTHHITPPTTPGGTPRGVNARSVSLFSDVLN
uniref:UBC core domain-containing protein n=1 Tax=Panagrellus redivivus TaxID=6233 RepID=A0A7E4V7A4_PANRE